MASDLRGQTAVVTGASQGLGLAIARRLLAEGASVSLWDVEDTSLRAAAEKLGAPDRIHTAVADVSSEDRVDAARDATLERFGTVSVLVNNAGVSGPHSPVWELSLADWQRVV